MASNKSKFNRKIEIEIIEAIIKQWINKPSTKQNLII